MEFLYFIAGLRNPVLDFFFETVTHLGEETLFLVISIIFFWCINKREGYLILISGLFGTLINQWLKLVFRIPRPWVIDPGFEVVGDAKLEATGYSFPSGHTQNVTTTFAAIGVFRPGIKRKVICFSLIALVAFSRMYLGVHTPMDVGVSLAVGALIILILRRVFICDKCFSRLMPVVVITAVLLSIGFTVYAFSLAGDTTLDPTNLESGMKNACTLLGCTAGLVLVYFVDTRVTNFDTKAPWYAQIVKALIGLGVVLLIKEGLRSPLEFLCGGYVYPARAIRYFLVVAFAGGLWPMTFARFARLSIAPLDRFGSRVASLFARKAK